MEGDSRIVPGGELNVSSGGLEGVVVDAASKPEPATGGIGSVASSVDFGHYTLNGRVKKMLESSITSEALEKLRTDDTLPAFNRLTDPAIDALVTSLGADFFSLDEVGYVNSFSGGRAFLVGNLKLSEAIPRDALEKGLTALLGDADTVKYLFTTDIANALGLDDKTKPVNLGDANFQQVFPDIARIRSLAGQYVIPSDPYILLLIIAPIYRRFLSACIDSARDSQTAPFSTKIKTDYNPSGNIWGYGLPKEYVSDLVNSGFLGLQAIVKTGQKHGLKGLKPYLDSLNNLKTILLKA